MKLLPKQSKYHPNAVPLAKLLELRDKGLNPNQIAKIVGLTRSAVALRLEGIKPDLELVNDYKKYEADLVDNVKRKIIDSITDAEIQKASLNAKIYAFGVLFDKNQILRGRPTQIVGYADLIKMREQYKKELEELRATDKMTNAAIARAGCRSDIDGLEQSKPDSNSPVNSDSSEIDSQKHG